MRRPVRRAALLACWLGAAWAPPVGAADEGDAERVEGAEGVDGGEDDDGPRRERQTVVTATRLARPLEESPTPVTVLTREELDLSASLLPDAQLRGVPSVATFRRSVSLVADPSSQGLNLRGIGPSAVSRGLVLLDGVPVNDPFGGWIYWRALPRLSLSRIEVAPGGASALYGSGALGGVVQYVTREVQGREGDAELAYGTHDTWLLAGRVAERWGAVGVSLEAERLGTDGYPVVAQAARGRVDTDAASFHTSLHGRVDVAAGESSRLSLRGDFFDENQSGGTLYTRADVRAHAVALSGSHEAGAGGTFTGSVFLRASELQQERAQVADGRDDERRSATQRVPARELGGFLGFGARPLSFWGTHEPSAGLELRRVEGHAQEELFPAVPRPGAARLRDSGGEQLLWGAYLQELYRPVRPLQLQLQLRHDRWTNRSGTRETALLDGTVGREEFPARSSEAWSPRVGARWQVSPRWALHGAGYRAFRAPSLNELYRPFQVGTVLTDSNPALEAERLWGLELGMEVLHGQATVFRATGYLATLESAIAVVSLPDAPEGGPTRRRENLGSARSQGLELSLETRLSRRLTLLSAYSLVDARVHSHPPAPEREGMRLAQVPLHRGTLVLAYRHPRLGDLSLSSRVVGPQFEDDLEAQPMGGYLLVDARWGRALLPGLEASVSGENLFDREYLVGRAGVETIGQPRMLRVGLRARWR